MDNHEMITELSEFIPGETFWKAYPTLAREPFKYEIKSFPLIYNHMNNLIGDPIDKHNSLRNVFWFNAKVTGEKDSWTTWNSVHDCGISDGVNVYVSKNRLFRSEQAALDYWDEMNPGKAPEPQNKEPNYVQPLYDAY